VSTAELTPAGVTPVSAAEIGRRLLTPAAIFIATFIAYYLATTEFFSKTPPFWYDHYTYLAKAMLEGTLDVRSVGIPEFFQDTVTVGSKEYVPFGPAPAVLLMPFVAVFGTDVTFLGTRFTTEAFASLLIGAANVALFWQLLGELKVSSFTRWLLVPFFAFGTVHFYSATTGTVWFFAHVSAVFFVLIAVIALLRGWNPLFPAMFLGLAFLSRQTTILAYPFFIYYLYRQHHESISLEKLLSRQTLSRLGMFSVALGVFVLVSLWYNYARFDDFTKTGYQTVYESYGGGYAYYQALSEGVAPRPVLDPPRFDLFDIRNIPLHIHAMFMIPPNFYPDWSIFRPSPYGMSVLLTSPAFVFAVLVKRKDVMKQGSWMAIGLIIIPLFLHYSQGWVQYGYRFLLDFAPFLLILTAMGFDDNPSPTAKRWQVALVVLSVVAGFWGRYWANQFGW